MLACCIFRNSKIVLIKQNETFLTLGFRVMAPNEIGTVERYTKRYGLIKFLHCPDGRVTIWRIHGLAMTSKVGRFALQAKTLH